ncbi:hypothetical protein [Parafilimonas sp.]|uniref:hypothetical protein n=1 Tax=Parafilimonas sp. TaxID=1969739 RepID=UPI0039E6B592
MKQLLLAVAIICTVAAQAQSDKYANAMQQQLDKFDSAKTVADYENIAAAFQRIGDAEKTQWLPYYWQGIALARTGWMYFPDDKGVVAAKVNELDKTVDALATRINAAADKADAVAKDNEAKSEILTVRNMAATQQMIIDPQSRYMTYGAQAAADLQKAMQLNPNNPRAAYLQAMSVYGTPEQFGGGKDAAKPLVQKAVDLAKAEQVKPLYPHWSLEQSEKVLATYQ